MTVNRQIDDGFSATSTLGPYSARPQLDGLMRSVIEQHTKEASYVFAGSHPGMMSTLFKDRERPFYGQASSVPLAPLPDDDLADYVPRLFSVTVKRSTSLAERVRFTDPLLGRWVANGPPRADLSVRDASAQLLQARHGAPLERVLAAVAVLPQ